MTGSTSIKPVAHKAASLSIVGISFDLDLVPVRNLREIEAAEVVIGHEAFIEQVRSHINSNAQAFDILEQVTPDADFRQLRVRAALEQFSSGRRVVMLSSGDPGIWGMAAYVLEAAATELGSTKQVNVLPAITAFQTAAAKLGAPLMNGFAACSLCDDLTAESIGDRRLTGAARGDFVTVVYKPRYNAEEFPEQYPIEKFPQFHPPRQRSNERLQALIDIFAAERPPATNVAIAANLGEKNETLKLTTLGDLAFLVETIPLTAIIIIGNSETRLFDQALVAVR